MIPSKVVFNLKLPDDSETRQKLKLLSPLETAFSHSVNELPKEYFDLAENLPPGSTLRVTFEVINEG